MPLIGIGFLLMISAFFWWALRAGKRQRFFFFAPYLLFAVGVILFIEGIRFNMTPQDVQSSGLDGLYVVLVIIVTIAFLLEFFGAQPKCSNCGRRLWMKKVNESDNDRYNHIGTKNYKIKSKSGKTIGEFEAPVSRTTYTYIGHYMCTYCGYLTLRGESETFDDD